MQSTKYQEKCKSLKTKNNFTPNFMTYQYAKRTLYYNSSTQRTKCTNGFNYSIQKQTSLLGVGGVGGVVCDKFHYKGSSKLYFCKP